MGRGVKLLLTSGGITNASIRAALVELLGKPIEQASALCIPTAQWGHPMCGPVSARGFVTGIPPWGGMSALPWQSLGLLELTALPTIGADRWLPWVRAADALLVDGGDATYLCHWLRASGLADLVSELPETVWIGVSAGSMVIAPRIGARFVEWAGAADDRTLGAVDFAIFPHLDLFPQHTMADAEAWAAGLESTAYALDDQSAIVVIDARTTVVSEGRWKCLRTASR